MLGFGFDNFWLARLADQLLNRWHRVMFPSIHLYASGKRGFQNMPFTYEKHKNSASNPYRRFGAVCIQRNKAIIARFLATTDVISGQMGKTPPGCGAYRPLRLGCQQGRTLPVDAPIAHKNREWRGRPAPPDARGTACGTAILADAIR